MSFKHTLPLLCAGLLLAAPIFAAPKPPAPKPPAHTTSAADNTSAVAVVSRFLALRAKNDFSGAYALLSAASRKNTTRTQFLAGASVSKAQIAQLTPELRGQYALLADPHNTLGYTFAVIGPDPNNPAVVLVHAFPKSAPGGVSQTLRIYTVAEKGTGKTSRRTVDALGSVDHVRTDSPIAP